MIKIKLENEPDLIFSSDEKNDFRAVWIEKDYEITKKFESRQDLLKSFPSLVLN